MYLHLQKDVMLYFVSYGGYVSFWLEFNETDSLNTGS